MFRTERGRGRAACGIPDSVNENAESTSSVLLGLTCQISVIVGTVFPSEFCHFVLFTACIGKNNCRADSDSGYTYEYLKGSLSSVGSSASGSEKLWIQMGADSGNGMFLYLVDATANGLGLSKGAVNVSNYENAGKAIDLIKKAIETVSSYRSLFGVQQNRLEHGMAIDKNTAENTQAAERRIRDLDLADEMVLHSQNNILV